MNVLRTFCGPYADGRRVVHVVASRLEHSDPAITLRVYAHVLDDQASQAAAVFERLVHEWANPESRAVVATRSTRTTVARLILHIASATMDGWQHTTLDFDPEADGHEARWAQGVALDGWRTWHASGVWVTVGNRYVRRWALRRPCARPWSAHDHASTCGQR